MSLFQKSVIKNQLESIDDNDIKEGWDNFQSYKSIINNIKGYKEEEFQFDFLKMIFNDCLGYKISDVGDEQRNLYTEVKNVSDSKKADGAIKKDDKVIAVIELKSPKTRDFKKIQDQAFLYKASHGVECNYVITSNFEKLRFYIDSSSDFEEFNLFNLTKDDFKLLYICLHKENLFSGIPKKLKDESVLVEENVTKKLYKDYSSFRKELFDSLVKSNAEYDKLTLFNKTQKLLDRFLFIFFAEDRNLVPANSISKIIDKWEDDISFGDSRSLYSIFKQYFTVLNTGRPARGEHEAIFAYNGGLFANDEILDSIEIDDNILLKHTKNLSHYDFESEISVNILGHIFENSLSEIEEIQSEISGLETETSKRKKDGVFYTPQYITKYMVESTLGKLCVDKKRDLNINEETYAPTNKRSREKIQNLDNYRNWLLKLTICDPACGSGAFLNQALSFLIEEHSYIDELSASYNRDSITLSDVKNSILENNLFGVDINEESIEIAKLSLWLRTAEKGRKLSSLSDSIKCGNSLIDDTEIAGDKAFNWQQEFPKVFANGGFDIVIGNPPYVQISDYKEFYSENFVTSKCGDLYALFYEKGVNITKEKGAFSFITPSLFIKGIKYESLRKFLLENTRIVEVLDKGDGVFANVQMPTAIYVAFKSKITNQSWSDYISGNNITSKILKDTKPLEDYSEIKRGLEIGKNKVLPFSLDKIKIITGEDVQRYGIKGYQSIDNLTYNEYKKDSKFFDGKRIVIRETGNRITSLIVDENVQQNRSLYSILLIENHCDYEYFLALINSSLMQFFYKSKFAANTGVFPKIRIAQVKKLPIKIGDTEAQNYLTDKVINIMKNKNEFEKLSSSFNLLLFSNFNISSNRKLKKWYDLDFSEFLKELEKARKTVCKENKTNYSKLTLNDEARWIKYFNEQKQIADKLISDIESIDVKIDQMVYELYGLTKEEIEIVENS